MEGFTPHVFIQFLIINLADWCYYWEVGYV